MSGNAEVSLSSYFCAHRKELKRKEAKKKEATEKRKQNQENADDQEKKKKNQLRIMMEKMVMTR